MPFKYPPSVYYIRLIDMGSGERFSGHFEGTVHTAYQQALAAAIKEVPSYTEFITLEQSRHNVVI